MRLKALFISLMVAFCALPARAQDYPTRALHIITANSVGGTSDIFVRALADKLQQRLGQPIIVENRPGGNMTIAGRACADAASDGYTICLLPNETLTLNQFTGFVHDIVIEDFSREHGHNPWSHRAVSLHTISSWQVETVGLRVRIGTRWGPDHDNQAHRPHREVAAAPGLRQADTL